MNCEYCGATLKTLSSLKLHQKTAKYCLSQQNITTIEEHSCGSCSKKFNRKSCLDNHLKICKENSFEKELRVKYENREKELISLYEKDRIIQEKDRIIQEQKLIIEEQKLVIKEFQDDQKKQNKDLTDRIQCIAEKAIAKPSTVNKNITTTNQIINNMMPITEAHLQEHINNLNPIHVKNGASGYAKFALEYPLKDMIVCTDFQRRNCKYKDENGNVVSDPEMTKITKRLFSAIKERNEELTNEYSAELQAKWKALNSVDDMNEEDFSAQTNDALEFVMKVLSQKRQANEMADGMKPELFYSFIRELAAGCYRADK
jgi:hypothetical protein